MKHEDFEKLVTSIRQAGKIRRGEREPSRLFEFTPADVKSLRSRLNKSQSELAMLLGVSVTTLQNWEEGRRRPSGPAQALLKILDKEPAMAEKLLSG